MDTFDYITTFNPSLAQTPVFIRFD